MLVLVALLVVALPLLIVTLAPPLPVTLVQRNLPRPHVVPAEELPPVEPLKLIDLTPDAARAYNETVPFSTDPNPAARPFHLAGGDLDQQRAIDCMAAAVLYEAGDDAVGEQAVAQVVINRVRHPAFPKSICAVVFQGSERSTGCQFTFSCDGALARWKPSDAAWDRARDVARLALTGHVDKAVGYSTHYHTDWVVPYWSSSLDKVARVGTHLFFRWTGWWGTPPAFNRQVSDDEPVIALLAALSPAHALDASAVDGASPLDAATIANGGLPSPVAGDPDTFLVTLDPTWPASSFAALATQTCGERPYCKFMAWRDKATTPATVPITPAQIGAMAFSYLRDKPHGYDKPLWNCVAFPRDDPGQCMKKQVLVALPVDPIKPAPTPPAKVTPPSAAAIKALPDALAGVHRKTPPPATAPSPAATPTPQGR
ncbi:cell wall hydrolase [Sphingomonas koreensis]|nr:cell wall hydrolase [Sphingomonas koreensis]